MEKEETKVFKPEKTAVPLRLVYLLISTAVACTLWIQSTLYAIHADLREMWGIRDMRVYNKQISQENTLKVPDIDDILSKRK